MRTKLICLVVNLVICIFSHTLFAQDAAPVKFGKMSIEDFDISKYPVDTSHGAVVIADVGYSSFEGNNDGWFTLVHKVHRRVKVISNKGFDIASIEIPLYVSKNGQNEERVEKLKAVTYNIENGKIVETKLSDDAVFKEKKNSFINLKKFTMPAIKPGCVFEYTYTINSDFLFNLQPWSFQGGYPRIWSEYTVEIPTFFEYVSILQGFREFDVKNSKTVSRLYRVRIPSTSAWEKDDMVNLTDDVAVFRWVMKNVPVLKEESFTTSLNDYVSRIEFQLSAYNFKNTLRKSVMGNWFTAGEELLNDESFGAGLKMPNNWLDADMRTLTAGMNNEMQKAEAIYAYVKSSIKNSGRGSIYLSKPVKEVYKSKNGKSQDINMLLITMLKHEGLDACPVILSTVRHGHTNEAYPLINKYNYVICLLAIGGNQYFLDASEPYLGFGRLPGYVYNGHARAVNSHMPALYFSPDTLKETRITNVMLFNVPEKAGNWSGMCISRRGYIESSEIRSYVLENGKQGLEKEIKNAFTGDYSAEEVEFEDIDSLNQTLTVKYKMNIAGTENADIIYFSPIINGGFKENPLKSPERLYPVEMPYLMDQVFLLKVEVPAGYVIDEIPKSEKVTFNENEGMFEYIVSKTDTEINLRSRVKLDRATFLPEDYSYLRDFFDYIVKKHSEQIVFKKKK